MTKTSLHSDASAVGWPILRQSPASLPDDYVALRGRPGLSPAAVWDGSRTWLVTKHRAIRRLLADPQVTVGPRRVPRLSATDGDGFRSMLTMDPLEHDVLRRLPTLRLRDPDAPLPVRPTSAVFGLEELPVF